VYIEADNIQIVALVEYLGIKLTIVTLNASADLSDKVDSRLVVSESAIVNEDTMNVQLFFKPGHYDLIY